MVSIFVKFVVGVTVFVAAFVVTTQALPSNCDRSYIVQPGDTCDSISAAQNVSTYQLATVNNLNAACANLYAGDQICLGITGQDCTTTYVVQSGDACGVIAANFGIPLSTLLANNPNVNSACTNIYSGEVLCTSSQIYVIQTTSISTTPYTVTTIVSTLLYTGTTTAPAMATP
ncbi:hypothetical protein SERLA73DRAFT_116577 [Serpula lacrymans var. lacrymans S7.3]|uniref:LysM domain-containing protein n=2 Tax=Serpula lacrymans var. lacrymans TaxID=341189 RepID=F8QFF3_SERL3|nr:uncharacterized protein SERLADRAFT_363977 [Serpula lacrymans var. lacrymans S7.9]EGN92937.1 hypothetical protein SERLA73DRAFT_116577 [Serpula lacrymans var. lacrymans S7.3]EGO19657.1 hypothetical protein SERLADRAFT_363977 [Serpula lacrymans var. lacrymans S7.9]